ncbi:MAG: hypothetical protein WDO68_02510 [Gammaproteobacteria bacterium]
MRKLFGRDDAARVRQHAAAGDTRLSITTARHQSDHGIADPSLPEAEWRLRVERLFEDAPILFRPQNGGDYPDSHVLADDVAPEKSGLVAHIATE